MEAMHLLKVERVINGMMEFNKTFILVIFSLVTAGFTFIDQKSVRLKRVQHFVDAMINDEKDERIFAKFLSSGNKFSDDRSGKMAKEALALVRATLKAEQKRIEVYKYSDKPETVLPPTPADGSDSSPSVQPLRFELDTFNGESGIVVNPEDVYVIRFSDEQFYVVFDERNKILSFVGIKLGGGVGMMKF